MSIIGATIEKIAKVALARATRAERRLDQIDTGKQVHGMDIYIQDTEPDVAGDYIWINTNINNITR